ncbi:MAG TPA: T9SS type A sorting domain-containing protein [Bacteroidia bacterium]|jgi:hypothetical protein|nr:T9SS type A sorting domain-containing protein [Bacteroidia bacterium]
MKKSLLILSVVALAFTAKAQIINPGFETWTTNAFASSAMDPNLGNATTGWWEFNVLNSALVGSSPISVTRVTDTIHGGTYAARVQTVVLTTTSYGYIKAYGFLDTLGVLVTGNLNAGFSGASFKSGIPLSQKITQFSYYYQYKPKAGDTSECVIALYKFKTGARMLVGGGSFKTTTATGAGGWQQANVTISYLDTITPDTAVIEISGSSLYSKPKPGSVLWVDDASVTLPTGINQVITPEGSVVAYPNPASTAVNFSIIGVNNVATLSIFDITGQKVGSTTIHSDLTTVNTQNYSSGLYIYQLYDNAGNILKSGKFSVVK